MLTIKCERETERAHPVKMLPLLKEQMHQLLYVPSSVPDTTLLCLPPCTIRLKMIKKASACFSSAMHNVFIPLTLFLITIDVEMTDVYLG